MSEKEFHVGSLEYWTQRYLEIQSLDCKQCAIMAECMEIGKNSPEDDSGCICDILNKVFKDLKG